MSVKTTGRSGLVCWTNHAAFGDWQNGLRFQYPLPAHEQRIADVEARPLRIPRLAWFVALWVRLFGARESMHAVFAHEPPVRVGEMRRRPGVLWPRVVTMRFVAGEAEDLKVQRRGFGGSPRMGFAKRLIAWRERQASVLEVVRHHGSAVYQKHAPKLSAAWLRGRS